MGTARAPQPPPMQVLFYAVNRTGGKDATKGLNKRGEPLETAWKTIPSQKIVLQLVMFHVTRRDPAERPLQSK